MQNWRKHPPPFPYLKHLQGTDPSFATITNYKLFRNKSGETFFERLKRMCTLFEINGQKDLKTCHFLVILHTFC